MGSRLIRKILALQNPPAYFQRRPVPLRQSIRSGPDAFQSGDRMTRLVSREVAFVVRAWPPLGPLTYVLG